MPQPSTRQKKLYEGMIALGSNAASRFGSPRATLEAALARLPEAGVKILSQSRFFATPAFPPGSGPEFVNAAAAFGTDLLPQRVLERLHGIEAEFGRIRHERWGTRAIDLDLIAWEDAVCPDAAELRAWIELPPERQRTDTPGRLLLPHPRLQDRAFVLVPLADIAPNWRHPLLGRTVREMRDARPAEELAAIWPLA